MPATTQNATNPVPPVPAASKEQIVTVEKVTKFHTQKGEKEVYSVRPNDGQPVFDIWETQYFKAVVGDKFRPVMAVIPSAYTAKDGTTRANMKAVVNFEKVGG